MQRFHYVARDSNGSSLQGTGDGATAAAFASQLLARGLTPVSIRADGGGAADSTARAEGSSDAASVGPLLASVRKLLNFQTRAERPDPRTVTMSLRELAALLKAGIPILRALRLVADTSSSPAVRTCYENVVADLDSGRDLAGAFEREMLRSGAFEKYDIAMVSVGERTGRLDRALHDLYDHRAFMRQTAEQVSSAMRYPVFVVASSVIAMVVLNIFVIPAFAKVFANLNTELPLLTRVLLGTSHAMVTWWPLLAAVAVLGTLGVQRWIATPAGRLTWDRTLLRMPLIGPVLNRIVLSRFASSLSSSLASGLTMTVALQATAQTLGNAHMAAAMQRLQNNVERGESLSRAAKATGAFPPALLQILAIGEESGTLDELLGEMAVHYHSEVEYAVRRLSSNLEPLLIAVFGAGVLVMALGVFLPMWELGRASTR